MKLSQDLGLSIEIISETFTRTDTGTHWKPMEMRAMSPDGAKFVAGGLIGAFGGNLYAIEKRDGVDGVLVTLWARQADEAWRATGPWEQLVYRAHEGIAEPISREVIGEAA
jgi:hypothetical protein